MNRVNIATSLLAGLMLAGAAAAPAFADPHSMHFAVISAKGKVELGGKDVFVEKTDVGAYLLFFKDVRNVKHCAYTVTIGTNDPKESAATGLVKVEPHPIDSKFMLILTMNKNGVHADRPFHVMAMCTAKAG